MEQDDQILLNELKQGDKSAYEAVFKKYYKTLVTKAYFILEDEMEAEDLTQNLFVNMWQKSHFLSINTSIRAYLFRAIHNECMMVLRNRKVSDRRLKAYTDTLTEEDEPPNECYDEQHLNVIFTELPQQRQKAFKLVYIDDKKYKEAAAEMGVSVNSVKTHLKLALKSLKDKIGKI